MDLDAVRTFVAVADAGQFQEAAAALSITQQAVSKRIAALEKDLDVRLFTRTARGAQLTIDGQAFLPHARELLRVAERAAASVRPGRRALRVDVLSLRIATGGAAARLPPRTPRDRAGRRDAVRRRDGPRRRRSGTIDATFRAVAVPGRHLPDDIEPPA